VPATAETLITRAERRARRDPRFADALAALVDAPTGAAGTYRHHAARGLNDQRRREAVETFRSGALTTAGVQQLLGVGTPQAVHRLRTRGRLIGAQIGNATWFPSWQFADGGLRPELARVLDALRRYSTDTVTADRVMRLTREELGDRSIADALDDPRRRPSAWALLEHLAG
jgi:hypothetical protein